MPSVTIGAQLGRYKIESVLGKGGMSVVYRATDPKLQRTVAIKVMHDYLAENQDAKVRFHREALAVAQLQHPNIIKVLDYADEETEKLFIVMELVDGYALSEVAAAPGAFSPPEFALLLARPIADALNHAHEAGIIHRDLKPENILIGHNGAVKLTDFGIARMIDKQTMTMTGTLLGSPAFMAPEYIQGDPTDHRADIFSFGAMLYQLTTGKLPFTGETPAALLLSITRGQFEPVAKLNGTIHSNIARIIHRCMAHHPDERYPTASDLCDEIDAVLEQAGIPEGGQLHLTKALEDRDGFSKELKQTLPKTYFSLGKAALEKGQTGTALEHFDRVLSAEPDHPEVREILRTLEKRSLGKQVLAVTSALVFAAAMLIFLVKAWPDLPAEPPPEPVLAATVNSKAPVSEKKRSISFFLEGRGDLYVDKELVANGIFNSFATLVLPGEHKATFVGPLDSDEQSFTIYKEGPVVPVRLKVKSKTTAPQPGSSTVLANATIAVAAATDSNTTPKPQDMNDQVRQITFLTDGGWAHVDLNGKRIANNKFGKFELPLPLGTQTLRFTNKDAQPQVLTLEVSETSPPKGAVQVIRLKPKDAKLYLRGAPDGSLVRVAGRTRALNSLTRDEPIFVPLPKGKGIYTHQLSIEIDGKTIFQKPIEFRAGQRKDVAVPDQSQ